MKKTYRKYTKEMLEPLVAESISVAEVMKKLDLKPSGGNHTYMAKRIKDMQISTDHFLGQRANSGDRHVGGPEKTPYQDILVYNRNSDWYEKTFKLRRALIESGRIYQCEMCYNKGEWLEQDMTLEIDHIDGDRYNNTPENLRFLCPNCHSLTPNHSKIKKRT